MPSASLSQLALAAFAGLIGLIIGSFLNVVIHRGPRLWKLHNGDDRGNFMTPRSYCPACRAPIPAHRLIPLVSYFLQGGRCARCDAPISARYPTVEALGATVAVAAVLEFGADPAALAAACFGWALIALAFIDLETGYLPDALTWPLIAGGLAVNSAALFVPFRDAMIGAGGGFVAFWVIGAAFEKLRGKEGLGQGDKKLLAAIGAWGGWMILPIVVFLAALATLGAVAFKSIRARKADMDAPIPFGPGICAAGFAALLLATRYVSGP